MRFCLLVIPWIASSVLLAGSDEFRFTPGEVQFQLGETLRRQEAQEKKRCQKQNMLDTSPIHLTDIWEIRETYQAAADNGHVVAQNTLATILLSGAYGPYEMSDVLNLYRASARSGNADAQNDLATLLLRDAHIPQNIVEAEHLYLQAVEQGLDTAQINIDIS